MFTVGVVMLRGQKEFELIFGGIPLYNIRSEIMSFYSEIWRLKLWNL